MSNLKKKKKIRYSFEPRTRVINFHDGVERRPIFHLPRPHNIVYGCLFLRFHRQRGSENWKCKTVKSTTVFLLSAHTHNTYVYVRPCWARTPNAHNVQTYKVANNVAHGLGPSCSAQKFFFFPAIFSMVIARGRVSFVPIKGAPRQIIFVSRGGSAGLFLLFRARISRGCDNLLRH